MLVMGEMEAGSGTSRMCQVVGDKGSDVSVDPLRLILGPVAWEVNESKVKGKKNDQRGSKPGQAWGLISARLA